MNTKSQQIPGMAEFLAKCKSVTVVAEGERVIDPMIRRCRCGCEGDWTAHTMRAGESGRNSSMVIR